jgi:hypothetical protein
MIDKYLNALKVFLEGLGIEKTLAGHLQSLIVIFLILFLALIIDIIMKRIIVVSIRTYVRRSENEWDDIFYPSCIGYATCCCGHQKAFGNLYYYY